MKKKKRFTVVLIAVLAFAALCITACASKKNNAAAVPESFSVSRSTEAYIDEFNIADYSVSVRYSDGTEKTYSLADYIAQADLDLLATLGSHEITVNLGGYSATITFTIKNHAFDGVTFPGGTVEYDGQSHSLAVAGLPDGANVTYANNGKTEPGTYNVTATLTRENYNPKTLNATLVIEKRELAVNITGETLIKYDGEEHKNYTVAATNLVDPDEVGLTLSYSGNMKDAGTYTVTASLAEHEHYKLTGNNTLTVTITREIHKVTFRQSGQPDRTVEVADLGSVAEEDIPRPVQETGYTVTWNADALAGLSSVTDDIVVEATKTPIQYNITYDLGGGTNNPGNPETYTVEDQLFTLLEPTPKRGSFGGWYTADNAGGVRKTTIGGGETGDITLYAHWLEYYITAADGFTIDGTKLSIDVHNTVANLDLQDKIHVSAHCTWKLYKDFEGDIVELAFKAISLNYGHNEAYVIVYSDESEYSTRYTLDIYRLSMCEYKFTDRGTNKSSGTLEERSTVDKIADPAARTGYEFAGWAVKGSSDIVEFPYTVNKNVEFVAQWIANTYTVHLNADGGDGLDEADRTMTYGSAYEFPVLTRTGYTFLGWFAGDDKLTEPNGKSTEPWTFDEDNMQITAKWQINKYNLTVETNNSDVGTVTGGGNFDYGTEVTITATAPTALGYIFSGWYKDGAMVSQTLEYTFAIAAANETYIAQYNIAPEMSNFVFTSDLTTCKITGIKDNTVQDIVVPDYVTSIAEGAFSGCGNLISITIPFVGDTPNTPNDKNQYPFGYIFGWSSYSGGTKTRQDYYGSSTSSTTYDYYYIPTSLTTVTITGSSYILCGAFYKCSNLTSITIPASVTSIGEEAFYNCSSLTAITIPTSVTSIGEEAFYNCSNLTEITIPASVTSIGSNAFYNCTNLQTVTFAGESKLQSIGDYAFMECSNLTEITIPASVTSIGDRAFEDCINLHTVNWNATNCTKAGSYSSSYDNTIFKGCTSLATVNIGENVESIPSYAFYNCTNLNTVNWNATNCTKAGSYSSSFVDAIFKGCTSFTTLNIGENVEIIPSYAFYNCTKLQTVNWNATNCTTAGSYSYPIFQGCTSLTTVNIGENVQTIPENAFRGCNSLNKVNITDLAAWCNIDFAVNPLSYAHNLYINDVLQEEIAIPQEITEIKKAAFYGCNATSVTIHNGVTSIGINAFYNCTNLQTVTFAGESKLKSIGGYAFSGCGFTEITIPASVTSIGNYAFQECTNLQTVTFADESKLESIGERAFYYCKNLQTVTFAGESKLQSIGDYAFYYCSGLTKVNITDLAAWCNIDFGNASANPLDYAHSLYINDVLQEEITTPQETTEIKAYAFYSCTTITSITISASVTSIGDNAFYGCSNLTEITIPASVTSIGDRAFEDCINLHTVNWNATNCTTTGSSGIFSSCTSLTTVNIGANVKTIPSYAFSGCSKLTKITIPASVTSIGYGAFSGCTNLQTAFFYDFERWKVSKKSNMSSPTELASKDVINGTTAAKYLRSTYDNYYWQRTEA